MHTLEGQAVVVLGGSSGIGLATARLARTLGDQLDTRRAELAATLPIRRVVGADDVAALAVHLMTNTALTAGTYDIDGGQQVAASA